MNILPTPKQPTLIPFSQSVHFLIQKYRDILDEDQVSVAKTQLIGWMTSSHEDIVVLHKESDVSQAEVTDETREPSPKKFKHIRKLITEKRRAEILLRPEEEEVKNT